MSKSNIASAALETASREELSILAKALNIAVGKSKASTLANLIKAGDEGKVHFKTQLTVSFKAKDGERLTYFGKTLRNYTSGPGFADETWLSSLVPVPGSPVPSTAGLASE